MQVMEYYPAVGLTITNAFEIAHNMAIKNNAVVIADINDIMMCISPKTNITNAIKAYQSKLNFKYDIENIKRTKQR